MTLAISRRTPLLVGLAAVPLTYLAHSLFVSGHDPDLDAFLYLGSRLNAGELIYLRDFENKLPFVQYLFALADWLGGIGAWRLITLSFAIVFGWPASRSLVSGLSAGRGTGVRTAAQTSLIVFLIFLILLFSQPGANSAQLSVLAGTLMYAAIAFWTAAAARRSPLFLVALSGATAALAVLVRPNYASAVPSLLLLGLFPSTVNPHQRMFRNAIGQGAVFTVVFATTVLLSFLPYFLVADGPGVLRSGLAASASYPFQQQSLGRVAELQLLHSEGPFYVFLYGALVTAVASVLRSRGGWLLPMMVAALSTAGLLYSIVSSHYLPHYTSMFVPYATMAVAYLIVQPRPGPSAPAVRRSNWRWVGVVIAACLLSVRPAYTWVSNVRDFAADRGGIDLSINDRPVDRELVDFLEDAARSGLSFYVPESTAIHRLLRHGRIGDGHPSVAREVLSGSRIGPVGSIWLFSDEVHRSPCLALTRSGKDLIILRDNENRLNRLVQRCITSDRSRYQAVTAQDSLAAGRELVFRRYNIFQRVESQP